MKSEWRIYDARIIPERNKIVVQATRVYELSQIEEVRPMISYLSEEEKEIVELSKDIQGNDDDWWESLSGEQRTAIRNHGDWDDVFDDLNITTSDIEEASSNSVSVKDSQD